MERRVQRYAKQEERTPRKPDEQAREEVQAILNRITSPENRLEFLQYRFDRYKEAATEAFERERARAEKAETAAEEYEALYGISVRRIFELYDERDGLGAEIDYLLEKLDFLEAALQNYASHAWNDLKRIIKDRFS
jgi:hypothetical protein